MANNYSYLLTVPASDGCWQIYLRQETDIEILKEVLAKTPPENNKTKITKLQNRIKRLEKEQEKNQCQSNRKK